MSCGRLLVLAAISASAVAHADEEPIEPLPKDSYLSFDPSYRSLADGGDTSELRVRGLLVYRGWLVPGVGPAQMISGLLIDVAVQRTHTTTLHAAGLADTELLHVSGVQVDAGAFGAGLAVIVPTATSSGLGGGVVRLGPAWFGQLVSIPDLELSLLVRAYVSDGSSTAFATKLQPGIVVNLPDHYLLSSDGEIEIDWLAHTAYVPVNLELARVFDDVVIQVGPEVDVAGPERGSVKLEIRIDYIVR